MVPAVNDQNIPINLDTFKEKAKEMVKCKNI